MSARGKRLSLKNEGVFEGYVGKKPVPVENRYGRAQCFLSVGHTPKIMDSDGKKTDGPTVWVHFACFDKVAEMVLRQVDKGNRILVDYDLTMQPDPRVGRKTAFRACWIRAIASNFEPRSPLDASSADMWRPKAPKDGTKSWEDSAAVS